MATVLTPHSWNQAARASRSAVKVPKGRTFFPALRAGTQAQCSREPMSMPAALGLINSQAGSRTIFFFCFSDFRVLLFISWVAVPAQERHEKLQSLKQDS